MAGKPMRKLPGPLGLPLVGNLASLTKADSHLVLEEWAKRYGSLYKIATGTRKAVVVSDRDAIRAILRARPHAYRRMSSIAPVVAELGLDGLFSSEGERWKKQRKLVQAAFAPKVVRALFPKIREVTERLLKLWTRAAEGGDTIDVLDDLMRYTIDVTTIVAYGEDVNTLEKGPDEFRKHLQFVFPVIFQRIMLPVPYWRYAKLPRDKEMDRGLEIVRTKVDTHIQRARQNLIDHPERVEAPTNMLEALVSARDEDDPSARLSDEDLWANSVGILLAGEDTTANTVTWMMHHVAKDPKVQRRWQAEADAVLGDAPLMNELGMSAALPYANGVLNEALRLRPPGPFLLLETLGDQDILGTTVPSGTVVILMMRAIASDDEAFSDGDRFDPSRWIEAEQPKAHEPGASLPFGFGPRICPGRSLGLLEANLVASMVAKNFHLEGVDANEVKEVFRFTMSPAGVKLRLKRR